MRSRVNKCIHCLSRTARCRLDFVQHMMDRFHGNTDLHLLPSFAFSAALAEYYRYREQRAAAGAASGTATGVHAAHENPELDGQLVSALLTFPVALPALVQKLQDQGAASGAAWQSVLQQPLFAAPHGADSATLVHLCAIFATRHADLWKAPDVLAWLLRCAEHAAAAAARAQGGSQQDSAVPHVAPADARALAGVTYPGSEENEYAHLAAAQFSDARPTLPPEQLAALQGGGGGMGGAAQMGMDAEAVQLRDLLQLLQVRPDADGQRREDGQVCSNH